MCRHGKLPDSLIKEVVAFINGDGGEIYIGIADDGTIIGINNPDETMNKITRLFTGQKGGLYHE